MNKSKQKTFIEFACTYFAVITLVLIALSPIYIALERAEYEKSSQSICDYAQGKARELEARETFLFHTARNIFADRDLQRLYYDHEPLPSSALFYDMSRFQEKLKLYAQNISDVQDVIVYIPKFDYVLTRQYIFKTRDQFYQYMPSSNHEQEDWLEEFMNPAYNTMAVPGLYSDSIAGAPPIQALRHIFVFPMNGDSNIRLLVMIPLNASATAAQCLPAEIQGQGRIQITDESGILLAESSPPDDAFSHHFQFTTEKGKQISIDIASSYFTETRTAILLLILRNIGFTLILGACAALYFAWNRSRPIERMFHIIRMARVTNNDVTKLVELEDVVVNMASEIHQCKDTIRDLDSIVTHSLLDRLFFGEFEHPQIQEALIQCYGPVPSSCLVAVFGSDASSVPWESVHHQIREGLHPLNLYVSYQHKDHLYLLMDAASDVRGKLEALLKQLREDGCGVIKAGISNTITSLSYVNKGTQQALRRLNSGLPIHGAYLFSHTYSSKATLNPIGLQSLDMLSKALLTWNQQTSDKALEDILSHLEPSRLDAVELRQLFFSLRAIYSTVVHQFIMDTDESTAPIGDDFFLPDDLDEYSIDTIRTTFTNLNASMHVHYQQRVDKRSRIRGMDILTYVEENFKDPNLCASTIATHFHVSEKYVFQLIKKACGETLNDKISFLRVQEGIRLLEHTDMSVAEIAEAIGFTSSNSMYKVFMRVSGVSPSSYRKKDG